MHFLFTAITLYVPKNCVFLFFVCFLFAEFRLAVVQLKVTSVKADNLSRARSLVKEAAGQGSKVVLLPVSAHF